MNEVRCRYCDRYHCSVLAREGKLRFTCQRCRRNQTVDLAQLAVRLPSHLQAVGLE